MKFLLDNNLPPNWAGMLQAVSRFQFPPVHVEQVSHLRELFAPDTADLDWIGKLSLQQGWTIISGDAFRKKNGAERKVIQQRGLSVCVLQPSWSSYPFWEKTPQIVHWWPRIVDQANSVERIAMQIPWMISGRFTQL